MSLFTSARERALWLWALVTVAIIYSTLGVARVGVEFLRERNLLRVGVAVILLVAAAAVAARLARRRPGAREIAVALGFAAIYTLAVLRLERSEERLHLLEYGLVAGLIYAALEERRRNGRPPAAPAWLVAVVATAALGWLDEGIQAVLPSRVYDLRDVALNAAAGVLAVGAAISLAWARRRDASGAARDSSPTL